MIELRRVDLVLPAELLTDHPLSVDALHVHGFVNLGVCLHKDSVGLHNIWDSKERSVHGLLVDSSIYEVTTSSTLPSS